MAVCALQRLLRPSRPRNDGLDPGPRNDKAGALCAARLFFEFVVNAFSNSLLLFDQLDE